LVVCPGKLHQNKKCRIFVLPKRNLKENLILKLRKENKDWD